MSSLFLQGHLSLDFSLTLNPGRSHLQILNLHLQRLFPNKVTFTGTGGWDLNLLLGGHNSSHCKETALGPSLLVGGREWGGDSGGPRGCSVAAGVGEKGLDPPAAAAQLRGSTLRGPQARGHLPWRPVCLFPPVCLRREHLAAAWRPHLHLGAQEPQPPAAPALTSPLLPPSGSLGAASLGSLPSLPLLSCPTLPCAPIFSDSSSWPFPSF